MADFPNLPIRPTIAPMEAKAVEALPEGEGWAYEPKWDGFRCLAYRDGDQLKLQSKGEKRTDVFFL